MKSVNVLALREREEWDNFLSLFPDSTFYDTYEWAEIQRAGAGITPYVLGFWQDGELVAIWPSFIIPYFGGNVLSCYAATNSAPLVKDGVTLECLNEIVEYVVSDATKRYDILHWSFDAPRDSYFTNLAGMLGFSRTPSPRCAYSLDTTFTSDVLWKKLASQARNAVRRARRSSLEVKISAESDDIAAFLSIFQSTMERARGFHGYVRHPDSLLPLLVRLESEQKMKLFVAADDGNVVAGVLLLLHKQNVHWWLGGSYQESWSLRPNELLMWSVIEWASESGYHKLDLGANPSDQAHGLNTFKRHLGAEKSELVRFTLPVMHLKDVVCTNLVGAYAKAKQWGLVPRFLAPRSRDARFD
jgi:CelD/BcsL family acetyltransferase involved in cellulose biosynthesis